MFHIENRFFSVINKVVDAFVVNLLWLLCSFPVVTMGAATTAFYYAVHKSIRRNRGYAWREFFRSFFREIRQATGLWFLFVALYLILGFDFYITYGMAKAGRPGGKLALVFLILIALTTMWWQYVFAYVARFSGTSKDVLRLTLFYSVSNLPQTILAFLVIWAASYILYRFPAAIFFVPVMSMIIINDIIEKVFKKYMTPEQLKEEDSING